MNSREGQLRGDVTSSEITGECSEATEAIEEIATSENELMTSSATLKKELMTSSEDVGSIDQDEVGVETFVVDRPDYDDIIFAGGTSPEVGQLCPGTSSEVLTTDESALASESGPTSGTDKTKGVSSGSDYKANKIPSESPNFISDSPVLVRNMSPLLSDDSPVLARSSPLLVEDGTASSIGSRVLTTDSLIAEENPVLAIDSPVLRNDSPVLARDSPLSRESPLSPESDGMVATESPVSPGLTDQTSSGDEVGFLLIFMVLRLH